MEISTERTALNFESRSARHPLASCGFSLRGRTVGPAGAWISKGAKVSPPAPERSQGRNAAGP